MSYATITDLNKRITQDELIRLTDEEDTGEVNSATIAAALEAADVEIDNYLAVRYSLPLANPQPLLVPIAVDIAIWNLYALDSSGVPENRKNRYQAVVQTLDRISHGKPPLGGEELIVASSESAVFTGPARIFSRDSMKDL